MMYGDIVNLYCRIGSEYTLEQLEFIVCLLFKEDLIYYNDTEELYDERDLIE